MPLDPHECHEYAPADLAAETTDPDAQEILVSTAQNWERLASQLADAQEELLAQCSGELLPLPPTPRRPEPSLVRASRYRRFDARLRLDHVHALFTRKPARSK